MTVNELIVKLGDSVLAYGMTRRYSNNLQVSGWILQKPKYVVNPNTGAKAVSFIVYQPEINTNGNIEYTSFSMITYSETAMELLRNMECVTFITCMGKLTLHRKKKIYLPLAMEINLTTELDFELLPEYRGKEQ